MLNPFNIIWLTLLNYFLYRYMHAFRWCLWFKIFESVKKSLTIRENVSYLNHLLLYRFCTHNSHY